MPVSSEADPQIARWDRSFFGHPRGLSTLFFTEMWERFSFYGMRTILLFYMTRAASAGGLGFPDSKAGAIYGIYMSLVYLVTVPGGWIADRILGQRRSVLWGGVIIALGHYSMAIPSLATFFAGLGLIICGTGLLKPNVSTLVGGLYSQHDARRDAGFSIFYMGINVGALIAPIVCDYLGENVGWHYGFGAAGIGMTLGVIQYIAGSRFLGDAGAISSQTHRDLRIFRTGSISAVCILIVLGLLGWEFAGAVTTTAINNAFGVMLGVVVVGFFAWLLNAPGYSTLERRRFKAIAVLFVASAMFWFAYEQAGSTLNLFAERNTDLHAWNSRVWGTFLPGYFQSFNPIMLIILAPVIGWIWVKLGPRDLSSTAKFSIGLILVAAGFAILVPVSTGHLASPWWLTITYFLHTGGELCLSPVGLSAITKLAPVRIASLIMGVWFLSISVGEYMGGYAASLYQTVPLPVLFGVVAGFCSAVGLVLAALIRPMKSLMGGVN
jgi:POT family proton-dependent oligopeptide transporter